MNISESILEYNFDGKLAVVYKKNDSIQIVNTVLNILENNSIENNLNIEAFNTAMTFIMDTLIFSDLSNMDKNDFIKTLFITKYFEKIEKYLYSEYLNIKQTAIYTIGKMSIKENVKFLESAFKIYYNSNPIICYRLLNEIEWLDQEKIDNYYSLVKNNVNLINSMTLSLFANKDDCYEIMVQNIQNNLKQKDWSREEYLKSIKYYKNHNKIMYGNYERLFDDIINYE